MRLSGLAFSNSPEYKSSRYPRDASLRVCIPGPSSDDRCTSVSQNSHPSFLPPLGSDGQTLCVKYHPQPPLSVSSSRNLAFGTGGAFRLQGWNTPGGLLCEKAPRQDGSNKLAISRLRKPRDWTVRRRVLCHGSRSGRTGCASRHRGHDSGSRLFRQFRACHRRRCGLCYPLCLIMSEIGHEWKGTANDDLRETISPTRAPIPTVLYSWLSLYPENHLGRVSAGKVRFLARMLTLRQQSCQLCLVL